MSWPHIRASFRHSPAFSLSPSKLNENFIAMQSNWSINTLFSQHEWDTSSCRDDDAIARRTTYKLIILSRSTDIRLIYMCINWVVKWITLFAAFPGHAVKRRRSCNRKNLLSWLGKYFRVEASTGREKNEQQGKHLSRLWSNFCELRCCLCLSCLKHPCCW